MVNALRTLPIASPFVESICVGKYEEVSSINVDYEHLQIMREYQVALSRRKIFVHPPKKLGFLPHALNVKQFEQIQVALKRKLTLIQGPPGKK